MSKHESAVHQEPAKHHDPTEPGVFALPDPRLLLAHITDQVVIKPKASLSTAFHCGADRLRAHITKHALKPEEIAQLTQACYDVKAGSKVPIAISFVKDGKPAKPKGLLRLTTDRGKLSAVTMELNGTESHVNVELQTPDETIKISVIAMVDGYRRGKVHLHLN